MNSELAQRYLIMEFRIADTFTSSLARLTGEEQKAVKTTAFDLQLSPANPGMSFHKLDRARDKNFWSIRVNKDIRVIVHKTTGSLLLCYVDHHDKAYDWAERRKLETHPKTGAAQLVVIRETVQEISIPKYVDEVKVKKPKQSKKLFARLSDEELLSYGVPPEWLNDVKQATEENYLLLADNLPGEAAEALLEIATGATPRVTGPAASVVNPFDHPDAQRRFRIMSNAEELHRALDYPWEKWTIFLHPDQKQWVEKSYAGPARVSGSAGTGKTIVALHRAVHLARTNTDSRVLLTTFTDALSHALKTKLRRLVDHEPRLAERIDIDALDTIGERLFKARISPPKLASRAEVESLLKEASRSVEHSFKQSFLWSEWDQIVDAWQLKDWPAYRDVSRLGRKTRLPEAQRKLLWLIFEQVLKGLENRQMQTRAGIFTRLAQVIGEKGNSPYDYIVVDESQDLNISQMRFLAACGTARADALFFAGDLGQRIFQQPFSWKGLGVDVRGRSRTLKVNYRTSHQIRMQADRLLAESVSDLDGNQEERGETISVFNGPPPAIRILKDEQQEIAEASIWLQQQIESGLLPHEIGLFVRSEAELPRAEASAKQAKLPYLILDDHVATKSGHLSIGTMHLAKGLEFRSVIVMACDDQIVPLQSRIESIGDEADLKEVYDTERHLLYVACTRARDHLLITGTAPASEFLDDMRTE
jgi:hypothetical protein